MRKLLKNCLLLNFIIVLFGLLLIGCSASEETAKESTPPPQPSASEMMQKEISTLKTENASLKQQLTKIEQDNRAATARVAELETQLTELKERQTVTPPPSPKLNITNPHEVYQDGLGKFRARNYEEAALAFQSILDGGAPEGLEDNCTYWLGECAYGAKKYKEAIEHFHKVLSFSRSAKKDDAQIMIANSYFAMGNKAKAKEEYNKLIDKYPASPYVKTAKAKLNQL